MHGMRLHCIEHASITMVKGLFVDERVHIHLAYRSRLDHDVYLMLNISAIFGNL